MSSEETDAMHLQMNPHKLLLVYTSAISLNRRSVDRIAAAAGVLSFMLANVKRESFPTLEFK